MGAGQQDALVHRLANVADGNADGAGPADAGPEIGGAANVGGVLPHQVGDERGVGGDQVHRPRGALAHEASLQPA